MSTLPLVGRDEELAAIRDSWRRLVGSPQRARVALLTGEPGAGKSRLVAEAVESLDPPPHRVLTGQARTHSPAPYDWTASALSGRDLSGLDVPDDALAWLTQRPDLPPRRFTPQTLLRAAVDAVRGLLRDGPGVLVVEDLHDLDPASLDLVSELAAAHRLPALLLITSHPPAEAPPLAARVLARVSGTPRALRHHLHPLTRDQVATVLEGAGHATDAAAAYRSTNGNAYRLAELIATGPPAGDDAGLTAREREVIRCLAAGMTNQQAASALGISVRTVTVHVSNLLRKTGAASRTEAALWAVRHGLAPLSAHRG